ncbi:MAG: CPBP family intramembrane metalloprotease [Actinomycetota bacterium]|nr:CPBP family intramembrane metalloprotease [Actinomycetota bacterium]
MLAFIVGGVTTAMLATGSYPDGPSSYPNLTLNVFHAVQAGFIEEVVVLAFVVTTLEQARRPLPEIIAVALLLRASYHIYYGPGVVGILIWASAFLWLYLRFRTIVPLIIAHSTWDVIGFLEHRWHALLGVWVVAVLGLLLTAAILWLAQRRTRSKPDTALPPQAGTPTLPATAAERRTSHRQLSDLAA